MSGSTDAADVAERRRLLAELEDAERDYQDSLYSHSKDSQSKALDEEMEAYNKANEDYIEQLRDKLDDTDAIIAETMQQVLANADVVLGALNEISDKHGVTLSSNVTDPWVKGKDAATEFKEQVVGDLAALTGEDGVVIPCGTTLTTTFQNAFGAGSTACNGFKTTVETDINAIKKIVEDAASPTESQLKLPWKNMDSEDSHLNTFSDKVDKELNDAKEVAQNKATDMTTSLAQPWKDATEAVNTFGEKTESVLQQAAEDAKTYGDQIKNSLDVDAPNYSTFNDGGKVGNITDEPHEYKPKEVDASSEDIKALQRVLNSDIFGFNLAVTGEYDGATKNAIQQVQKQLNLTIDGKYGENTRKKMIDEIDDWIKVSNDLGGTEGKRAAQMYKKYKAMLPDEFYAKGTMGTTSSHWAITDEPQYGDELVLIPTKEGNLSYMRKGTSVIPADITENLVKWGQMNPDMSQMTDGVHGVNVMTNVVNKPTVDISFDSLLHVDNCSQDALPQVKRLINEQLENFARKLNYNLKKVGAT